MSDDEVDFELLALLRERLGIGEPSDEISRDTGSYHVKVIQNHPALFCESIQHGITRVCQS